VYIISSPPMFCEYVVINIYIYRHVCTAKHVYAGIYVKWKSALLGGTTPWGIGFWKGRSMHAQRGGKKLRSLQRETTRFLAWKPCVLYICWENLCGGGDRGMAVRSRYPLKTPAWSLRFLYDIDSVILYGIGPQHLRYGLAYGFIMLCVCLLWLCLIYFKPCVWILTWPGVWIHNALRLFAMTLHYLFYPCVWIFWMLGVDTLWMSSAFACCVL